MQNTNGKLLENIIACKLVCDLESRRIFPSTLGGYPCNNETWLNIVIFANYVFERFHAREKTSAAAIDLDDEYSRVTFG